MTSFKTSDSTTKGRFTTLRIFEATIPGGTRCFAKEYLAEGQSFGKRELSVSRKLSNRWNDMLRNGSIVLPEESMQSQSQSQSDSSESAEFTEDLALPPFPILLGYMKPDERIESDAFRILWRKKFPNVRPPEKGNLWLIYKWDDAAFKSFKRFPALPQIGFAPLMNGGQVILIARFFTSGSDRLLSEGTEGHEEVAVYSKSHAERARSSGLPSPRGLLSQRSQRRVAVDVHDRSAGDRPPHRSTERPRRLSAPGRLRPRRRHRGSLSGTGGRHGGHVPAGLRLP